MQFTCCTKCSFTVSHCNKASNWIVPKQKELGEYWIFPLHEVSRHFPTYTHRHTRTSRTFCIFAVHWRINPFTMQGTSALSPVSATGELWLPRQSKTKRKCVYVVWMHWPKQTKSKLLCNDRGLFDIWNKELCEHCRYANHLWETLDERSRHCNTDILTQILQVMMLCGEKTQKLLVSTDSELSLCSCICLQNEFYQACDIALKKVKELGEK